MPTLALQGLFPCALNCGKSTAATRCDQILILLFGFGSNQLKKEDYKVVSRSVNRVGDDKPSSALYVRYIYYNRPKHTSIQSLPLVPGVECLEQLKNVIFLILWTSFL